jgi:hypothetical protein
MIKEEFELFLVNHKLDGHETKCPCGGQTQHNGPHGEYSYRIFKIIGMSNPAIRYVFPCVNHVEQYVKSPYFEEVKSVYKKKEVKRVRRRNKRKGTSRAALQQRSKTQNQGR